MAVEPASSSLGEAALTLGALSLVTFMLLGLYSLGYYGLGYSPEESALENINTHRWSQEVKTNIQYTYVYLFASFYICISMAVFVFSNPTLYRLFSSILMLVIDFVIESIVQYGRTFAQLDSRGIFSHQKMAWFGYCSFLGGMASPSMLFGSSTVKISINLTFFVVFALIILSFTAPAGKFVTWDKNLRIFEFIVLMGNVGNSLFPMTTFIGALSFSIKFYGGLILFQLFFLCHSQEAHVTAANATPSSPYCPPAMSVPMLLDAISIFSRIVVMVPSM